ncbi:MAG: PorP/SprF family type IX secretion system membrane protein [Saprospiraceae bacterium]|nr:PorP/SprF family type IX secretion system membrane protein [Saprospiraceae bacterium]
MMEKIKRYFFIICLCFFCVGFTFAQDIHFSQFSTSPLNLNPAQTGFFQATHRFILNNKSQWRSVTVPYSTISASFDMPLLKRKFKGDMFGIGVVFNSDKAGDSEFGTTQANLSFSYLKSLNQRNNHFISFGLQGGIGQRTINYDDLFFDSQYNGNNYDPNLFNGENFTVQDFIFNDIGSGVHWFYQKNRNLNFSAGLAVFHINRPKISLLNDGKIRLNEKYMFYGNSQFEVSDKVDLMPGFLFASQGKYKELIIGSNIKFERNSNPKKYTAMNFGVYTRTKDAVILIIGMEYKRISYNLSYDINYSKLKTSSNSMGGLEISINYLINKSKTAKIKAVPCPIF